ncbi:sensor domain-containing diguanylate cyclase [Fusibacter paucivorans]|uniref:Sensor domain-containing diguanylate cyclase n=1 Tax=Fusibacter paucivorans TaxID=76009 RepID=A0ABS5PR00_9FIRM|nr:diguanylate cyclase [Fusibacter paucivorans]MBS7527332.1 sensor domain-containing diguanylate cyclase [Fusibacter paucivorans]
MMRKPAANPTTIKDLIKNQFIRSTLLLVIVLEVITFLSFAILIISVESQTATQLRNRIEANLKLNAMSNANYVTEKSNDITVLTQMIQRQFVDFFILFDQLPIEPNASLLMEHANGAFYSDGDDTSSSLYYAKTGALREGALEKALKSRYMDPYFKLAVQDYPILDQIYFNAWDGMTRIYPSIDELPILLGSDMKISNYNFYYLADDLHNPSRDIVWTDVYLDPAGQGWMISCIAPVYDGDFLQGVVGLDITIENLIKDLINVETTLNSAVVLTNESGLIIAMNEEAEALLTISELKEHAYKEVVTETITKSDDFMIDQHGDDAFKEDIQALIDNGNDTANLSMKDKTFYVTSNVIGNTDWRLIVFSDQDEILKPVHDIERTINKVFGLIIIFMVVLNLIILRMITDQSQSLAQAVSTPLNRLKENIQKFGNGRMAVQAFDNTGIEEIDVLNFEFYLMSQMLNERTKKLIQSEIQNREQHIQMENYLKEALTDELTGLMNRRGIEDMLDDALSSDVDLPQLTIIIIDIDHFKSVNDQFGHLIGDEVLIAFTELIQANLKEEMTAARWGGEEFMIICKNGDINEVADYAEALRKTIETHHFVTNEVITASFGVATVQDVNDGKRPLIQRADQALYKAKSNGRNCVCKG